MCGKTRLVAVAAPGCAFASSRPPQMLGFRDAFGALVRCSSPSQPFASRTAGRALQHRMRAARHAANASFAHFAYAFISIRTSKSVRQKIFGQSGWDA